MIAAIGGAIISVLLLSVAIFLPLWWDHLANVELKRREREWERRKAIDPLIFGAVVPEEKP